MSNHPNLPLSERPIHSRQSLEEHSPEEQNIEDQNIKDQNRQDQISGDHRAADPSSMTQSSEADVLQQTPLDRRRFLGGMLSGAVALVAAACGRDRTTPRLPYAPTATPSPVVRSSIPPTPTTAAHHAYLPYTPRNGAAVATAPTPVDTLEPTETPIPAEPTATPKPPPTPTPVATPFPAGAPSKLGFVVARNVPELFTLLATKAVAVVCTLELDVNFAAHIKQTSPSTWLIGRLPHLEQIQLSSLDPIPAARAFYNEVMVFAGDEQRRRYFDAWQSYNEPVPGTLEEMRRFADFEAERTRLLGQQGIRSIIGNFGTGQPTGPGVDPFEMWNYFLPAMQVAKEHNGWLGLHEYSAPTIYHQSTREDQGRYPGVSPEDTGWLTLRYRQVYNQILKPANLALPLVFTEIGVDGLVGNRAGPPDAAGWQDFQGYWRDNGYGLWGPGAYIEQLVWFDEAMRQDSYVLGGCIFALGASDGWQSYDILGPAVGVLQQYLSVHAPT